MRLQLKANLNDKPHLGYKAHLAHVHIKTPLLRMNPSLFDGKAFHPRSVICALVCILSVSLDRRHGREVA